MKKIMVVDDEPLIATSTGEILQSFGYEVMVCFSGVEAAAKAEQFNPNLILSDVVMPEMNGFETALSVKRVCPRCAVLLFSGQAATAEIAEVFLQAFSQHRVTYELLPKPLHPKVLLDKIEQALMMHKEQQAVQAG